MRTFSICLTHLHVQTLTCTMVMHAEHSFKMQYSMCEQSPIMKELFLVIPRYIFVLFRNSRLATSMKFTNFVYTLYYISFLCSMFSNGEGDF